MSREIVCAAWLDYAAPYQAFVLPLPYDFPEVSENYILVYIRLEIHA
jgi:hypothetical protein